MNTEPLARAAALHPWRTIAAWIAVVILAGVAVVGTKLPDKLSTDANLTNNPESQRAYDLIGQHFRSTNFTTEVVVVRNDALTVDDPAFQSRLQQLTRAARATGAVESAEEPQVSPDRHAVLIPIRLTPPEDDNVDSVIDLVSAQNGQQGFQVAMTGEFTSDHDFNQVSQEDLEHGELRFGVPAAMIVLVLVFGALVAAGLPLILAITSILVAFGLTALVSTQFELSVFVQNMITGMGLALGIDYALFVVSRFREERTRGLEKLDAISAAGATASRAVLFSGSAFVLAMTGLLLVQSTIMRSLAAGAILVGIASVAAALTLLPAVLSLLGDKVNRLRVPYFGRERTESRFWTNLVHRVQGRPWLSLALGVLVLLIAAAPAMTMKIGAAGSATLPDRLPSKQGFLALERSFPAAGAEPAEVAVPSASAEAHARVDRLTAMLARDKDFGRADVRQSPDGAMILVRVPVAADELSDRALNAVERLRHEYVPAAFAGTQIDALVTGTTAENQDYFDVMKHWLPIVLVFVLGLSFVLLTVAFRSIVVAATAIVLNLLSFGAAFGLMVGVFQHGWGAGLLGFNQVETIEAWVPLFLFAVLFGLSMDYQVFLLSRIRERFTSCGDTKEAVAFGIGSTARIITGAALIIVAVFLGFAMGDLVMFQQMGFGIAIALLLDATLVRGVLVPAAMTLLGDANWYLPRWLAWLPHVEVERHEAQPRTAPEPAG
ncbi:MAG TPA: MMPL family transporter [Gaiellaceae bacterium]|nr:MMPL family transporter [Gaiellaceae bacterium]